MKKTVLLISLLLLCVLPMWGKPVTAEQARQVAATYLRGIGCQQADNLRDRSAELPYRQFYLFAADEGGFALVAADDCVAPILGSSATGQFVTKSMPAHVADWLQGYENQIAFYAKQEQQLRESGLQVRTSAEPSAAEQQWQMLLQGQMPPAVQNTTVSPLVSTTWNQSPYYNNLCPADNGHSSGHAVAGCTAIATAQVMKYWNHPATGYGSRSYSHSSYGTLSANFGSTNYAWTNMPTSLTSSSTTAQINAVATLVYHVGVAVRMDYSATGSGARTINYGDIVTPSAENALRTYFKYKPTLHSIHRADYAPAVFDSLLVNELINSRPIIFTGYDTSAGHAFVLDGVNNSGNFHVNWGWGGYCDGYYAIGSLNPSTGGTGGNTSGTYNIDNSAIIGIQPNTSFSNTASSTVTTSSNSSSLGAVAGSGTFSFGDTVTLVANAAQGCRFVQWGDGDKHNPRKFIATGGNISLTARFEQLQGDTLGYASSDSWLTSFGGTSDAYWGIKLPASALTAGHNLRAVQMMVAGAGSYTASIYVGSVSSTPALTQTFSASSSEVGSWKTIALSSPVAVTGSQDVWITFHNTDVSYPAALTYDGGNNDGMLWGSSFSSIRSSWHYTFMVRGIFGTGVVASGDTISYCGNSAYQTSVGAGGSIYWGIKLPNTLLLGRHTLTAVGLYVSAAATYQLTVSQVGASAPSIVQLTQNATFTTADIGQWKTITLSNPVTIDSTQPLWVTFYCNTATHPAAACAAVGDDNSSWVSTNGTTWSSLYDASDGSIDYSWMIKCITSATTPAVAVSLSGPATVGSGLTNTYTATCNYSNATYAWTAAGASSVSGTGNTRTIQWNTPGTYSVIVAATANGTTVRDTLQVTVQSCYVTTFPYNEGFESGVLGCWSTLDGDGDGYTWDVTNFTGTTVPRTGTGCAASASYINNVGVLTPNNWLISPGIVLPAGYNITLSWYTRGVDTSYASEVYAVYLSTTGTGSTSFTHQLYTGTTTGSWVQHTADLTSYAGQTVNLAFRHYACTDQYWLALDDVSITTVSQTTYTVTVIANNTAYGTVTGGGTYPAGSTATLTATPNTGYRFVQWSDGDTHAVRTITVTGNATYVATFQPRSYDITVVSNDNTMGTVAGGGTYPYGTIVTLTATPCAGCELVQWSDGDTHAVRTITVTGNVTYVATFQPSTYTITVTPNDPLGGSVTGSGTYGYLDPVTLTATAYSGYVFMGWSNGEAYNPYTFPATQNLQLQAIFESSTPTAIDPVADDSWTAFAEGRTIVVLHAAQHAVRLYDISGRLVASTGNAADEQRFDVSHGGLYFVVVDDGSARKVMAEL